MPFFWLWNELDQSESHTLWSVMESLHCHEAQGGVMRNSSNQPHLETVTLYICEWSLGSCEDWSGHHCSWWSTHREAVIKTKFEGSETVRICINHHHYGPECWEVKIYVTIYLHNYALQQKPKSWRPPLHLCTAMHIIQEDHCCTVYTKEYIPCPKLESHLIFPVLHDILKEISLNCRVE